MKTVKDLFDHLSIPRSFKDRYPGFDPWDKKIHILFLSTCMHESGYYRMILPALEINKSGTHAAIIAHIHRWDYTKSFEDYDNPIDFQLVTWADYVVLPPMFSDVGYIINSMRNINSNIDFVMDLDSIYHELPPDHPGGWRLTTEAKNILLHNISQMDVLTAPNSVILNYYNRLANDSDIEFSYYSAQYPNLLSNYASEEITTLYKNESPKVRIGVLMDSTPLADLKLVEAPITKVIQTNQEKVELIIYGWSENAARKFDIFKGVSVKYEPSVYPYLHPQRLNELMFDIGIIPYRDNIYNHSGRSFNRFLDFAGLMVPVIAAAIPPFKRLFEANEFGYTAASEEDWIARLQFLIDNPNSRKEVGEAGFKLAWERFSYTNPKALQRLRDVFS